MPDGVVYVRSAREVWVTTPRDKSIVVLDITIGRDGTLERVTVRRSNGFKQLEARALESVRQAAPYAAPGLLVRHGGSVNFLETFLFRADGRFQIRSLIGT